MIVCFFIGTPCESSLVHYQNAGLAFQLRFYLPHHHGCTMHSQKVGSRSHLRVTIPAFMAALLARPFRQGASMTRSLPRRQYKHNIYIYMYTLKYIHTYIHIYIYICVASRARRCRRHSITRAIAFMHCPRGQRAAPARQRFCPPSSSRWVSRARVRHQSTPKLTSGPLGPGRQSFRARQKAVGQAYIGLFCHAVGLFCQGQSFRARQKAL